MLTPRRYRVDNGGFYADQGKLGRPSPVPGDGQYEWKGFLDGEQMPWVRNPARGFVTTSNEMNVPNDWPTKAAEFGFEWWEPSRANRI